MTHDETNHSPLVRKFCVLPNPGGCLQRHTGEGIGTLKGVEEKLDYLQWLGIDCIWLSPFYASPLRDDGYDIADYRAIHPDYGTMEDFDDLIEAIHARGMKLITDLALNHTSMDHRWFQESRKDPHGPYGDYYVWGDDPNRYPEIRIIFTDTESSNWSFDEVRGQYYFHRFYKEQPDLNYDSPAVHKEVLSLIDFGWTRASMVSALMLFLIYMNVMAPVGRVSRRR